MDLFPQGVKEILRVLKGKAYYAHRFLEQISALYDTQQDKQEKQADDMTPTLYLSTLFRNVEETRRLDVGLWCAKQLVTKFKECPAPAEVAELISEGALQTYGLDFPSLQIRAQEFFLIPPTNQEIANQWVEKVMYTAAISLGREGFNLADPAQWRVAVTAAIISETPLLAMEIVMKPERPTIRRSHAEFSQLKKMVGISNSED